MPQLLEHPCSSTPQVLEHPYRGTPQLLEHPYSSTPQILEHPYRRGMPQVLKHRIKDAPDADTPLCRHSGVEGNGKVLLFGSSKARCNRERPWKTPLRWYDRSSCFWSSEAFTCKMAGGRATAQSAAGRVTAWYERRASPTSCDCWCCISISTGRELRALLWCTSAGGAERQNGHNRTGGRAAGMGISWWQYILEVGNRSATYEPRRVAQRPVFYRGTPKPCKALSFRCQIRCVQRVLFSASGLSAFCTIYPRLSSKMERKTIRARALRARLTY